MNLTTDIEHTNPDSLKWLKANYFSDEKKKVILDTGEKLLDQGSPNPRLYLIESGRMKGTVSDENSANDVFLSGPGLFVGIYSFFSTIGRSYSTVIANEPSVVYYISREDLPSSGPEYDLFTTHMMPILVHEIYLRQIQVIQRTKERQAAIEKLYQNEKMATLGQLAAGLAHELNNAIGVISNSAGTLMNRFDIFLGQEKSMLNSKIFDAGMDQKQLDSRELRTRKKALVEKYRLNENTARRLIKMNLPDDLLEELVSSGKKSIEERLKVLEVAQSLKNLQTAATHTEHVIQSIRELGARGESSLKEVNIHQSIQKAIILLSNLSKKAKITVEGKLEVMTLASEGDLIQVWLNLIKNAIEALVGAGTKEPLVRIAIQEKGRYVIVKITDNGPGIAKEIKEKIFHPNVSTKIQGLSFGLGLGLSIVEKIILGYGGHVDVESKPGETSFIVTLLKI